MPDAKVPAYRIVARIKNNRLWQSIREAFPDVRTQTEAARRLGIGPTILGDLLNMRRFPYRAIKGNRGRHRLKNERQEGHASEWSPIALRIAEFLGQPVDYLFDPVLYGRPPFPRVEIACDPRDLLQAGLIALPPSPEELATNWALREHVLGALTSIPAREAKALALRFGLADGQERTFLEIAQTLAVSHERAQQIVQAGLDRLRHPAVSKGLSQFLDNPDEARERANTIRRERWMTRYGTPSPW